MSIKFVVCKSKYPDERKDVLKALRAKTAYGYKKHWVQGHSLDLYAYSSYLYKTAKKSYTIVIWDGPPNEYLKFKLRSSDVYAEYDVEDHTGEDDCTLCNYSDAMEELTDERREIWQKYPDKKNRSEMWKELEINTQEIGEAFAEYFPELHKKLA
jgi:hypothetical protein